MQNPRTKPTVFMGKKLSADSGTGTDVSPLLATAAVPHHGQHRARYPGLSTQKTPSQRSPVS